jgi:hypothetical protein
MSHHRSGPFFGLAARENFEETGNRRIAKAVQIKT